MNGRPSVLTVPASFDEEARELTLQAALDAGLEKVTLLEEPLAALYAWIAAHPRLPMSTLGEGALVLVCDVGGGTTDFSLICASIEDGELVFERIAIGEHLLLGGDNLDLALAVAVEEKLPGGAARLSLSQRLTLRRKCSAAKEQLLSESGPSALTITILGAGSSIVGSGVTADLSRDDVSRALLEGFLPLTAADDLPARSRRAGLRELGLPYETEPAITRHLAAFLTRAGEGGERMAHPDAVLFNGGFFAPGVARERVLDALSRWSGKRPLLLENGRPEASVAIGAAFYGRLRGDPGRSRRLLIRAGSARAYYIGVAGSGDGASAVCVMPRGTQEGTRASLDRDFTVIANQPSAFTLFSTMTRSDPLNAVVTFSDEDDDVHRHAPLVTALRFGKRSRRVPLTVRLTASFTETGTLELWCESTTTEHRWRLSFSLRGAGSNPLEDADEDDERNDGSDEDHVVIADEALHAGNALIRGVFGDDGDDVPPGSLVGALENALGHGKQAWPLQALRSLADTLIAVADGRRKGTSYEVRWLNLVGFCTRPGFGAPTDPWRISELRKVYLAGLVFPKDVQAQVEWLVLWQRVAAGFTTGQQKELAQRVVGQLGIGQKRPVRINAQLDREAWRLLGTLERIDAGQRVKLGDELVTRTVREPRNAARAWALGRMGARNPLYGPLNNVVPASAAERWIRAAAGVEVHHTRRRGRRRAARSSDGGSGARCVSEDPSARRRDAVVGRCGRRSGRATRERRAGQPCRSRTGLRRAVTRGASPGIGLTGTYGSLSAECRIGTRDG